MIGFSTYLTELFDVKNIFPWERYHSGKNKLEYIFQYNDRKIAVNIETFSTEIGKEYEVSIYNHNRGEIGKVRLTGDNDLKTTIKVYNTVIDILRKELMPMLQKGDAIVFDAAQKHMQNVYDKFAKMVASEIGGKYQKYTETGMHRFEIKVV